MFVLAAIDNLYTASIDTSENIVNEAWNLWKILLGTFILKSWTSLS